MAPFSVGGKGNALLPSVNYSWDYILNFGIDRSRIVHTYSIVGLSSLISSPRENIMGPSIRCQMTAPNEQ